MGSEKRGGCYTVSSACISLRVLAPGKMAILTTKGKGNTPRHCFRPFGGGGAEDYPIPLAGRTHDSRIGLGFVSLLPTTSAHVPAPDVGVIDSPCRSGRKQKAYLCRPCSSSCTLMIPPRASGFLSFLGRVSCRSAAAHHKPRKPRGRHPLQYRFGYAQAAFPVAAKSARPWPGLSLVSIGGKDAVEPEFN